MNILGSSGFNPVQIQRQMQDKFNTADTDDRGSLTLEELTNATPEGTDISRMENMFARVDSNGDGEVTQEERDSMVESMQERMKSLSRNATGLASANEESDPFDTLMKALADTEEDSASKGKISLLRDRLQQEGRTKENMQEAAYLVQSLVPSISETV
jgi:Ca2+-binding EF-hand superfamily protein